MNDDPCTTEPEIIPVGFKHLLVFLVLVDKELFRMNRIHNNDPFLVLILIYNFHIHKNIGRHR